MKKYVGSGALALALLASPALVVSSAEAMPANGTGTVCRDSGAARTTAAGQPQDTPAVSAAARDRVDARLAATRSAALVSGSANARAAALPTLRVKVQIHIIHGRHKGERQIKKRTARKKVFAVLRSAYNGAESSASEPMGIVFDLRRITVTTNERWYHAKPDSRADRQMKRRLHRGKARTLNIYVNKLRGTPGYGVLLGFSHFPWQYRAHPKLDGVVINVRSLNVRGSKAGFNLGDTVVHETGHWLGLYHTFQSWGPGGCDPRNDGVRDTPAETDPMGHLDCATAGYICDAQVIAPWTTRPTTDHDCTIATPCADPKFNFMEYTYDSCMRMFTVGQRERVVRMFQTFRAGR